MPEYPASGGSGGAAVTSVNGLAGGTLTSALAVTGALTTSPVTLTDAATISLNAAASGTFKVTLGGNRTLGSPSNPADGQMITVEVIQDATGSRTLAYGTAYQFPAAIGTPVLSSAPGSRDFLAFRYNADDTTWWCVGFVPDQVSSSALPIGQGGTGQTSQAAALTALTGTQSSGTYLRSNGTAAALSSIQPADVPATPGQWVPADNALLAATDLPGLVDSTSLPVAGTLYLTKLPVRVAITATYLWLVIGAAGVGASSGSYLGLYSSAGTLLSGTADIGTQLTTGFVSRQIALTIPQSLSAGSFVWVALLTNLATTQPSLRQLNNGTVLPNIGLSAATYRFCTNGTGLTSLPGTITPSSGVAPITSPFWFGVS